MKKQKRWKIIAAVCGVIVVGLAVALAIRQQSEKKGISVSTAALETGSIHASISAKGTVEAKEKVNAQFQTSGRITEILVAEGDAVKKGDPLIRLDSEDVDRRIRDAELQVQIARSNRARSSTGSAQTAVSTAQDQLEKSQKNLEDSKALYSAGVISRQELDNAEAAVRAAGRALSDAQSALSTGNGASKTAALQVEAAENALSDLKLQKQRMTLSADIDGTVTEVRAEAYDLVTQGTPVLTIESLNALQIVTYIGEYEIAKLSEGMSVDISGDSVGEAHYKGTIQEIGKVAISVKSGQAVDKSVKVIVSLEGETAFKPNFSADLELIYAEAASVLTVPYEGIKRADVSEGGSEAWYVYTVKDGRVKRHAVSLGIQGDLSAEIISDTLKAGDAVILNPSSLLEEGMEVSVQEENGQ